MADGGKYFSTEQSNGDKPRPLNDAYNAVKPQTVGLVNSRESALSVLFVTGPHTCWPMDLQDLKPNFHD